MTERICAWVRDLLPDWLAGGTSSRDAEEIETHLRRCGACADERDLLESVRSARPVPPAELASQVVARLQVHTPGWRAPSRRLWARRSWMGAAAAVVVALGSAALWTAMDSNVESGDLASVAMESIFAEDWVIAGEPVLSELPEDALWSLLEELEQ